MRNYFHALFHRIDPHISGWMERNGIRFLRLSLGLIFIWFGALKIAGMSPENDLITHIIYGLNPSIWIPVLGWWEILIGMGLLIRPLIRVAIALLVLLMPGTLMPLFLLPDICFAAIPFGLTMEGQYIIKNLVLISASIVVGGTVRKTHMKSFRW